MSGEGDDGDDGGGAHGPGVEVDRLAGIAADVSIVEAVHGLQGQFIAFFDRETRAYHEAAGAEASDAGLAVWINERQAEMRRAWRSDVDILTSRARS